MKLVILGATGPTGQQLVSQALQQGHEVTAIVRNPSKLNLQHEQLKIISGDIFDRDFLTREFDGKDVVISALGTGKSLKSGNLVSRAIKVIVPSMKKAGVSRVIFLSAFGVGESFRQASFIQKLAFRIFLRSIYSDKAIADDQLRSSGLEWTLVRPVLLTNGEHTGNYRSGETMTMNGMPKISRADVADCMISGLSNKKWIGKTVILSY
jgi:putative NADH-flavin reductase